MIKRFKEDNNKLNDYIITTNLLTDILENGKKKQYSSKIIDDFEIKLNQENIEDIIKFMFENKINLKDMIPTNYRQIQIIYLHNNNNIEVIKQFSEYDNLSKYIKSIIFKKKKEIIETLRILYKNSSRQKGNLLKKYFIELLNQKDNDEIKNKKILNNIDFYGISNEILDLKDTNKDFIYIPSNDDELVNVLFEYNIHLKKEKGRDFFARYKGYYFIGEAKEIHEEGGSQTNNFNDLLSCLEDTNKNNKIIGFGILYGACNLYNNKYQKNSENNDFVVSLSELSFNLDERFDEMIKKIEEK